MAREIEALAWWDWEFLDIRRAQPDFRNLDLASFIEKYKGKGTCRKSKTSA